ncbi:DsbA family oxidoreductase [Paenibacillus glycanilyticus]|uniref:DsbA family oxidoreductase n=1 Tax=Paenibacillus glycanilyticus TaxID=126569 RepID=UPI0020406BCC|nr:DsbA family oxidoreductase [Paenibacillus glycanilyticus]MCM3631547.1 DsbA family oxidoreductase [Paenibacillus glycanilyticus]
MKVEVWSDFACPFCYIGKRRLEEALGQFEHGDQVEVEFKSFELDPNAPVEIELDVYDYLSNKYGMSREQAISNNVQLTQQAKTLGLDYRFDTMVLTNTFDAHQLTHFAAKYGKREEMAERLFKAYFTDSKHLGKREILADLAAEIGLDREEALKALEESAYKQEVRSNEQEAGQLGVRGVPFFVIDRKYAVSGAQPSEVFLQAVSKAWEENKPLTVIGAEGETNGTDDACADGFCAPNSDK